MRKLFSVGLMLLAFAFTPSLVFAQTADNNASTDERWLHSIDVLTGIALGELNEQGDHAVVPLIVDFNFNLKNITDDWNWKWDGMLLGFVETFGGLIVHPRANLEAGVDFGLKIGFLSEEEKFQPYVKGGLGVMYMTLQTIEQGTQFNFNEFIALGFQYKTHENAAFIAEYRFRHLSNADIDDSNGGINDHFALFGFSLFY